MKEHNMKMPKGICPFSEIAQLYYPNIGKFSASRKLRDEIEKCDQLISQLKELGYSRNSKDLTPAHRLLIEKYIGPLEL